MDNDIYKYLHDNLAKEAEQDLSDVIEYCKYFRDICKGFTTGRLHADTFKRKAEEQERALLEAVITLCAVADKVMAVRDFGPELSRAVKEQKVIDEGMIGKVIEISNSNAASSAATKRERNPRSKKREQ